MASRRLDISSLLCADDSPPIQPQQDDVVLIPRLLSPNAKLASPPLPHSHLESQSHSPQDAHPSSLLGTHAQQRKPSYLGLEALVHAATEERRRLVNPEPDAAPRASPVLAQPSPRSPYNIFTRYDYQYAATEDLSWSRQSSSRHMSHTSPMRYPTQEVYNDGRSPTLHPSPRQSFEPARQQYLPRYDHVTPRGEERGDPNHDCPQPHQSSAPFFSPLTPSYHSSHSPLLPHDSEVSKGSVSPNFGHTDHLTLHQRHADAPESGSHLIKKRRYSASISHPISPPDDERLDREREKMAAGGLGYGRVRSPTIAAVSNSVEPFSNYVQKRFSMSDLISTDRETAGSQFAHSQSQYPPSVHAHRVRISSGRRTPPGSQAGRAKAAKKLEEVSAKQSSPLQLPMKADQHVDVGQHRKAQDNQLDISHPVLASRPAESRPSASPSSIKVQEDAHEWFLEHFDDDVPPSRNKRSDSWSSPRPLNVTSTAKGQPSPRTTMPDAAEALEQELENVLVLPAAKEDTSSHSDAEMDVDSTISKLVAETLEEEDVKNEDLGMEVDVEDELLRLIDDRPTRRSPSLQADKPSSSKRVVNQLDARYSLSVPARSVSFSSGAVSPSVQATPELERGSCPPPLSTEALREQDEHAGDRVESLVRPSQAQKKKKDRVSKPSAKTKAVGTKSRSKPAQRAKTKGPEHVSAAIKEAIKLTANTAKQNSASRSRSTSVLPGSSVGPEADTKAPEKQEEENEVPEDDKLYCICKTQYDEDRFMIACDRCDEWYHTLCLGFPELEIDLVDQFICPSCIERNPHLSLRTTYKQRCLNGLEHENPNSPEACHKPARGAFSKYCSDECGIKYMQSRLEAWTKKGGKKDKLWGSVKDAEKREGIVIYAPETEGMKLEGGGQSMKDDKGEVKQEKSRKEREVERLTGLLDQVVKLRDDIKQGMEVVLWRGKLLQLASARAEQTGNCGWDQRLCFGDEEWADYGAEVLESYDEKEDNESNVRVDDEEGEWWCPGKKMCDRHAGWQNLRHRDICKEKEKKEEALRNLTTRERELRMRIEDLVDPHRRTRTDSSPKNPLKPYNGSLPNGQHSRAKPNVDGAKKGKKRKVPV